MTFNYPTPVPEGIAFLRSALSRYTVRYDGAILDGAGSGPSIGELRKHLAAEAAARGLRVPVDVLRAVVALWYRPALQQTIMPPPPERARAEDVRALDAVLADHGSLTPHGTGVPGQHGGRCVFFSAPAHPAVQEARERWAEPTVREEFAVARWFLFHFARPAKTHRYGSYFLKHEAEAASQMVGGGRRYVSNPPAALDAGLAIQLHASVTSPNADVALSLSPWLRAARSTWSDIDPALREHARRFARGQAAVGGPTMETRF